MPNRRIDALAALVFLAGLLAAGIAAGEPRVALVIGNGAYTATSPLLNPPADAALMARSLRSVGFEVVERTDTDRETMLLALREFGDRLDAAGRDGVGLFYYAGHGVQVGGRNYMIPTTAEIARESDVAIYAVSVDDVLATMEWADNRLNFVILDACRNNPYARGFRSSVQGLARMDAPSGTLIAYATAPGDVAADGAGSNSPYTSALVQAMARPGLSAEQVFKQARVSVMSHTGERQVPWESSSLTGEFFFAESGEPAPRMAHAGAPGPSAGDDPSVELAFWRSVEGSGDPALYRAYLDQYPQGRFAAIARVKAGPAPAPNVRSAARACEGTLGNWKWSTGGKVNINADGTAWHALLLVFDGGGKWVCEDAAQQRIRIEWDPGWIDTMTLSADGTRIEGNNQYGMPVAGAR